MSSDEQVVGLDVAMDDTEGVRRGQRFAGLQHIFDHALGGQRPLPTLEPCFEELGEAASLQILHDDVRAERLEDPDVEHLRHVLTADTRGNLRLLGETSERSLPSSALQGA